MVPSSRMIVCRQPGMWAIALAGALLLMLPAPLAAVTEDEPVLRYERFGTRADSRRAALRGLMPVIEPGPWWIIGPFDNTNRDGFARRFGPEEGFDPAASYPGKSGVTARWRQLPLNEAMPWSIVDLRQFGSEAMNVDAVAYLYREIIAEEAGEIVFEAGSDDGLKLWFNDVVVVEADEYRGLDVEQHVLRVPLRAGVNRVLAKVTQGPGDWQFQIRPRLDGRLLAMLEYYLDRDFPSSPVYASYRPLSIIEPPDIALEVGGLAVMPDGRPIVATRRGDVYIVSGADEEPPFGAQFTRFASGLHEPLGAIWHEGSLWVVQRGELTRLTDLTSDDRADRFETVSDQWGLSGNYHEFAFGPSIDGLGRMWVTLNIAFCGSLGKSLVPWRGWAMIVEPDGSLTPVAGGLRSPNGLGANREGEMFSTDNQGDWVATNKLMHLAPGDWHGHPSSNDWYAKAGMPAPRGEIDFKLPAVWFPYDRMGRSPSDILLIEQDGRFGPYDGHLLVGDQYAASIMRVYLEEVNGVWQGACFPFIDGLDSGVNRLAWGHDDSLYVGMTNRGWWSFGRRQWGLQRIVYTGEAPFDLKEMNARPDGFELVLTAPADPDRAGRASAYAAESFTHERTERYGAPEIDRQMHEVRSVTLSPCRTRVRIQLDAMRRGYVYGITLTGVTDDEGRPLLHGVGFYTLNEIPGS